MKQKFYPLYTYIMIEPMEQKSASGIILTQAKTKQGKLGKVVGVGLGDVNKDGQRIPMEIKVGEVVSYSPMAPDRHVISEGVEYLLIAENEVYGSYGIVEGEAE